MNKKAAIGDITIGNVIFLVLLALVIGFLAYYIPGKFQGAEIWEGYYSQEIVKMINFAEPGDEFCIDVQKATEIAEENRVPTQSERFEIDNTKKQTCVKLSRGEKTCFNYFNDVEITYELKLGRGKDGKNILCLDILKPRKTEEAKNE